VLEASPRWAATSVGPPDLAAVDLGVAGAVCALGVGVGPGADGGGEPMALTRDRAIASTAPERPIMIERVGPDAFRDKIMRTCRSD
jgi:hypothetical protein